MIMIAVQAKQPCWPTSSPPSMERKLQSSSMSLVSWHAHHMIDAHHMMDASHTAKAVKYSTTSSTIVCDREWECRWEKHGGHRGGRDIQRMAWTQVIGGKFFVPKSPVINISTHKVIGGMYFVFDGSRLHNLAVVLTSWFDPKSKVRTWENKRISLNVGHKTLWHFLGMGAFAALWRTTVLRPLRISWNEEARSHLLKSSVRIARLEGCRQVWLHPARDNRVSRSCPCSCHVLARRGIGSPGVYLQMAPSWSASPTHVTSKVGWGTWLGPR